VFNSVASVAGATVLPRPCWRNERRHNGSLTELRHSVRASKTRAAQPPATHVGLSRAEVRTSRGDPRKEITVPLAHRQAAFRALSESCCHITASRPAERVSITSVHDPKPSARAQDKPAQPRRTPLPRITCRFTRSWRVLGRVPGPRTALQLRSSVARGGTENQPTGRHVANKVPNASRAPVG